MSFYTTLVKRSPHSISLPLRRSIIQCDTRLFVCIYICLDLMKILQNFYNEITNQKQIKKVIKLQRISAMILFNKYTKKKTETETILYMMMYERASGQAGAHIVSYSSMCVCARVCIFACLHTLLCVFYSLSSLFILYEIKRNHF